MSDTMVTLKCCNPKCGKDFERRAGEANRKKLQGKETFCSKGCAITVANSRRKQVNTYDISEHAANRRDKYTVVRCHLRRAQRRQGDTDLSLDYLLELWERQEGLCVYSGVRLRRPTQGVNDPRFTASLDRIDPSKPYERGNVQFVSACMNYAKAQLSDKEFREWLQLIR